MSVREVITYPNPVLKEPAADVDKIDAKITQIITDLIDTMVQSGHSVGIAAPQISESFRIVVADASRGRKPSINHGQLILINPEIVKYSGMQQSREGCMSVPDYTGTVNRAESVTVKYHDINFNIQEVTAVGFEAILLQHELDHLDGVLFIDRVISKRTDLFRRK